MCRIVALPVLGRRVVDLEEELQDVAVVVSAGSNVISIASAWPGGCGRSRWRLAAGVADPCASTPAGAGSVLHTPETAAREHGPLCGVAHRHSSIVGSAALKRLKPSGYSQAPSWAGAAASWSHRRLVGTGDRRPVRHPAPRRPRCPRDQGGAAGQWPLRARLRAVASRGFSLAFRVGEPQQGVRPRWTRRTPAGWELLHRLVAGADVFVHNVAPGAADRLGLGAAALRAEHPGLIVCDISGYGDGGPYTTMKAYDLMVQSEAGLVSVTGGPGRARQGRHLGVGHRGGHVRLLRRAGRAAGARPHRAGRSVVDVSMLESTVEWMGFPLYYSFDGAPTPAAGGRRARHDLPCTARSTPPTAR